MRRLAVERLRSDLGAWSGAPVFAYGFEDLTGAEWALLEALSARTDVTVSIPYEPGRAAFEALERTVEDLAALAAGASRSSRARPGRPRSPGARPSRARAVRRRAGRRRRRSTARFASSREPARAERSSFSPARSRRSCAAGSRPSASRSSATRPSAGARRSAPRSRSSGAVRGRARPSPRRHGDRPRAALAPPLRLARRARAATCSCSCARRSRGSSGVPSTSWKAGCAAGRSPSRIASTRRASGSGSARPRARRRCGPRTIRSRACASSSRRWCETPGASSRRPSPTTPAPTRAPIASPYARSTSCTRWPARGVAIEREDVVAALERTWVAPDEPVDRTCRGPRSRACANTGVRRRLRPRARGGRVPASSAAVAAPRATTLAASSAAASSDPTRSRATATSSTRRARGRRSGSSSCARPRATRARRASRARSGTTCRSLFDDAEVQRATRRRALSALTWPLESAPSERERLRAVVRLAAEDVEGAYALAAANDWSRRLDRARGAFDRATALRSPAVLEPFAAKTVFSATELERFADCSSAWLFERVIDPKKIDAEPDPMLRGQVLHTTLHRFYAMLPRELDSERVTPENVEAAIALVHRCLDDGARVRASGSISLSCRRPSFGTRCAPISKASSATRPASDVGLRAAPARGRVRIRARRAGAAARPPARGRRLPLREDRPDRHRPVQRARDRPGLQVGQGRALGARDRS